MNPIKKLFRNTAPAPIPFPEVNFTYTKPEGMTDEQCGSLPCFRSETFTVSCWQLSPRDRLRCLFGGKVWLMLMMNGHPPVCITPESPFEAKPAAPAKSAASPLAWAGCVALVLFAVAAVIFALKLDIRLP